MTNYYVVMETNFSITYFSCNAVHDAGWTEQVFLQ